MKPSIFRFTAPRQRSLEHFLDLVHSSQMTYWASDLLSKGLKPDDIRRAVQRAMTACKLSGKEVRRHFQPMYTATNQGVAFDDCKLSKLGYALTLLNANVRNKYVAQYQLKMVERIL